MEITAIKIYFHFQQALGNQEGFVKKNDSGYLIHSGIGSTTWRCIKMSDGDVALVAKTVDNAINSGGNAKLLVY